MSEVHIRHTGRAGRITLARPQALNALTREMVGAIDAALAAWAADPAVALVVIDAEGDKAFCAGGDIEAMYRTLLAGDLDYGRRFWRDEYRMNARIARYPKPVVALMQGYTMGGGVGLGCHASHRVVGDSSRIAMPECGIGLVPDVGGSLLLARAPGRLGEYLAVTGARMRAGDAILAGFADHYLPEADWPALVSRLEATGDETAVAAAAPPPPDSVLAKLQPQVDAVFGAPTLAGCLEALDEADPALAAEVRAMTAKNSPLSMACALEMVRRVRAADGIGAALALEYRFTHRAGTADFAEGIRAKIIDRDDAPRWRHARPQDVTAEEVAAMLAPLGDAELVL